LHTRVYFSAPIPTAQNYYNLDHPNRASAPLRETDTGVSVVIATLGGECLSKTIDSLLSGSKIPDEILICIPVDHASKVSAFASGIIKIIPTEVKGQVKQRAFGFTQTDFPLVMQLDDDILLEKESVKMLVDQLLLLGKGNVIGPVYYGKNTKRCIHDMHAAFSKNLFDYIICAAPWGIAKMGKVTSVGINYGVDDSLCKEDLFSTDWLPGGCVLSFKEDLVTKDFFPFTGKAYCEDVFHSYYRTLAGTRSWVATGVKVYIDEPIPEFSKAVVEKVISIRRQFLKLIHGPQWRLFFYEVFCRIRSRVYPEAE